MDHALFSDPDRLLAAIAETLRLARIEHPTVARLVTTDLWADRIATATGTRADDWWHRLHDCVLWLDTPGGEDAALDRARGICDRAAGLVGRQAA